MGMLTYEAARELLAFHCGADPRIEDERWTNGLLATLRPYQGLRRDAMASVDDCLDAVAPQLLAAEVLDRSLVSSLWGICHYTRAWALHPEGMLQSNRLITAADARELEDWVEDLSDRISTLLDGSVEGLLRRPGA